MDCRVRQREEGGNQRLQTARCLWRVVSRDPRVIHVQGIHGVKGVTVRGAEREQAAANRECIKAITAVGELVPPSPVPSPTPQALAISEHPTLCDLSAEGEGAV